MLSSGMKGDGRQSRQVSITLVKEDLRKGQPAVELVERTTFGILKLPSAFYSVRLSHYLSVVIVVVSKFWSCAC